MNNYSLLVIDDEPDNFDTIEALLVNKDYQLHYASSGRDAVNCLDRFDPDLILLDAMMPEMDGFEVCQRLKSIPQWQAVPIIMVTALTSKEDLLRCLSAGADDFIAKPVNSIELRGRVQSMLRIKKQHDRIQSLSKLQRNNIHSLENNLNELRLDLSAGFPDELNVALKRISEQIDRARAHCQSAMAAEVNTDLEAIARAVNKLEKLHQSFLFYLQLSLGNKGSKKDCFCAPKISIEQLANLQSCHFKPSPKLIFDIEDVNVAVKPQHMQYIIAELLDNALNVVDLTMPIYIRGRAIDDAFHFWVDNSEIKERDNYNTKLTELIGFNSNSDREQILDMRLKIVKKIVEIYDGLFLAANTNLDNTTIYVALPLAK